MKQHGLVWRRTAIAAAVGVSLLAGIAQAQTNTTGTAYGTVQAAPGATVVIENTETGFKRTVTPDANGRFNATALPTGKYKGTLMVGGQATGTTDVFEVKIGQGSELVFAAAGTSQVVTVTGKAARLDMSSSNNGVTFTSTQLAGLPIARNLDAIIQLAPNTTRADPRYSGGASIGGGAPSENSYYINGFPVTNALNQLGSSELPFGAISQAQVLTGGFGAEFGRSIGGVVNVITKSGTNTWEGGFTASITPSTLRSSYKDILYPKTGASENSGTDGQLYRRASDRTTSESSAGAYVGGPLVQDKLFMWVGVERQNSDIARMGVPVTSFTNLPPNSTFLNSAWEELKNHNDRYLAKFDWNISKNHLLEATLLGDKYAQTESLSGYDYATGAQNGIPVSVAKYVNNQGHATQQGVGSNAQILRYTGFLTEDLTITGLIGQSSSKHVNAYNGVDVYSNVRQVRADTANRYPGFAYTNPYPFQPGTLVLGPGSEDTVNALRFDLEYKLGSHLLRAGVDKVNLKSENAGDVLAGNGLYRYFRTTNANLKPNGASTSVSAGSALTQPNPAGTTAANSTFYYYGYEQVFSTITGAESNQSAFYLEDKWQVTKDLLITPGVRIEKYDNVNGDGQSFLKVDTQLHPRFAFAWDLLGDKSTKLFGSAGRYGVQIPTHLAVRGASRSTFTRQPYTYQGVDAQGVPTGRVNLGDPFSANNEYGQAKDAKTVAALDMKPNSQDEFTLGLERALSPQLNVGARFTYRKLVATVDDLCDPRPFQKYADDNGINTDNWAGFGCASFNPGEKNKFLIDYAGNGTYTNVNLSKADLGFDDAKRTYMAMDLFAEHPYSNGWYGRVNYTFAKSKGNTEGQTLSDVAQTDVAATQTWDHPELMQGANGYLPNDRRHQIKAYGFVSVTPEIDVGANLLLASGRPKNCIGNFAGTPSFGTTPEEFEDISYGSAYRFCTVNGVVSSTPRGSAGNLPWDTRLDMNLVYRPEAAKGFSFKVDVFNLLNKQTIQAVDELHEVDGDPSTISATYGRVISYTAPRSLRFTLTYDTKF